MNNFFLVKKTLKEVGFQIFAIKIYLFFLIKFILFLIKFIFILNRIWGFYVFGWNMNAYELILESKTGILYFMSFVIPII